MALFEVEGWDIKTKKIAFGATRDAKIEKRQEKNQKRREKQKETDEKYQKIRDLKQKEDKTQQQKRKIEEVEAEKEEQPEETLQPIQESSPLVQPTKLTPLQQKMMAKLSGSRFRWINEQLYTITSDSALKLIKEQPSLFDEYHQGFRSQVQAWPENPVNVFVDQIKSRSNRPVNAPGGLPGLYPNKEVVIADMGCGEAQLSLDVSDFLKGGNKNSKNFKGKPSRKPKITVHSFDLKKVNNRITVADIKNVPLPDESCTIVIFCLALMGTNFLDFIEEAHRILAPRGELWVAEIKSRFTENEKKTKEEVGDEFVNAIKMSGFFHKNTDNSNKMFTRFEFFKPQQDIIEERNQKLHRRKKFIEHETETEEFKKKRESRPEGQWLLKPCIYKRR
ncbi:25S rRNA (adenine645-N1)-methyltransferase [Yamadazyma tenuis]|uniref:Ribosomal RNA-processing protein 8 n=1 Tax=Candida tenuis (strain ATCC 10573 / BCRC 21748 / CBS 615 / JCM 9827 / NBRC 10315 / NRRL Y-1498 / VKM Y-70) TaxID=590646 RepID=G3B1B4_CANTC|nr:uncharacterized protein CANTEDRAFT_97738 [Yamadazyma tenuis ATCC 10573]EGV64932.1 hypothetical protein CANTEDRAFT_97738 [Yamadazyma tenuis ATCC 10573]WEJ97727.1 25S rRNA (adenine645-N1)-methyltransferase [Yamadazyma tenuis]